MAVNEAGIKVGDVFVSTWGYDQTNVDFYKVVAVTAKGVRVQAWKSKNAGEHRAEFHDSVVPGDAPRTWTDWSKVDREADYWTQQEQKVERDAPIKFHRLYGATRESAYFTLNSYSGAHLWEGSAVYETAANFGH